MTNDYMLKSGTVSTKEATMTGGARSNSTVLASKIAASPMSISDQVRADMGAAAQRYGTAAHRVVQKRYAVK